jgi:D-tyrosyl-tRNA(Tyr) deacylase
MRGVVQRVNGSRVVVDNHLINEISAGLLLFLGVEETDTISDVEYMVDKVINLRIFEDSNEKMNLSLKDVNGELMVISQFTLYGDARKGRRPSFIEAARPQKANDLYEKFIQIASEEINVVKGGKFQSHMIIGLENDGPVTILLDSRKVF